MSARSPALSDAVLGASVEEYVCCAPAAKVSAKAAAKKRLSFPNIRISASTHSGLHDHSILPSLRHCKLWAAASAEGVQELAEEAPFLLIRGFLRLGFGRGRRRRGGDHGRFRGSGGRRRRSRGRNQMEEAGGAGDQPMREQGAGVQMAALLGLGAFEVVVGLDLRRGAERGRGL